MSTVHSDAERRERLLAFTKGFKARVPSCRTAAIEPRRKPPESPTGLVMIASSVLPAPREGQPNCYEVPLYAPGQTKHREVFIGPVFTAEGRSTVPHARADRTRQAD